MTPTRDEALDELTLRERREAVAEASRLVFEIRRLLPNLSPEDRIKVFSLVAHDYCTHCGFPAILPDGQPCQCNNDE